MPLTINSDADLNAAIDRAEGLVGCASGSEEERELAEIAFAVLEYERKKQDGANASVGR